MENNMLDPQNREQQYAYDLIANTIAVSFLQDVQVRVRLRSCVM